MGEAGVNSGRASAAQRLRHLGQRAACIAHVINN
jgi:hypothetical protein